MMTEAAIVSEVFVIVPSQPLGILIIFAIDGTPELFKT
jgi:hypothetical protein